MRAPKARDQQDERGGQSAATAITASIVALGRPLGLTVVAEGVETADQLRVLQDMGCTWGQGWLWHRALPPDDLGSLLTAPTSVSDSA